MLAGEGARRRTAAIAGAPRLTTDAAGAGLVADPAGIGTSPFAAVTALDPAASGTGFAGLRALAAPPDAAPRWLRAADGYQRSLRRPLPVAADVLAAAAGPQVLTGSLRAAAVLAAAFLVGGLAFGLWKRRSPVQAQGVSWYTQRLAPTVALGAAALGTAGGMGGRPAAVTALVAGAALTLLHGMVWVLVGSARRRGLGLTRTLVIGSADQVSEAERRISLYPEAGLVCVRAQVAGVRPSNPARSRALIEALLADHAVEHIVCSAGDAAHDGVARDVIRYAPQAVDVTVMHPVPLSSGASTRVGDVAVTCLNRPSWGTDRCKRAFDLVAAGALLSVLSPVLLITALAVRLGDPGPVVFRQARTGRGNRQFTIYKFRSMVRDAEALKPAVMDRNVADGLLFKAEDDPRITRVGGVIRRFSLDELPQLLNVVRGQMSLVGPRPLPTVFDDADVFAGIRHQVPPGITGLWQVKGANALPYDDMIDLDCSYVATRSLGLDLRILLQTIPAVVFRRDPY